MCYRGKLRPLTLIPACLDDGFGDLAMSMLIMRLTYPNNHDSILGNELRPQAPAHDAIEEVPDENC